MVKNTVLKILILIIIQIVLFFLYSYLRGLFFKNTFHLLILGGFFLIEVTLSVLTAIVLVKELKLKQWLYSLIIPFCLIFNFLLLTLISSISNPHISSRKLHNSSYNTSFKNDETAKLYNYGNKQISLENYELAIEIYDSVLSIEPFHPSALLNKSACFGKLGLIYKEIEICKIGIKYHPNYAQFYSNIAMSYLSIKNFKEVIPNLIKARELDNKNHILYTLNIAQAFYEMNEYQTSCYILDTIQTNTILEEDILLELNRMKNDYCN